MAPLYEYHCEGCDLDFEDMRPMADRGRAPCVGCGEDSKQAFLTPPNTDVYGHDIVDHVNGITYTSASERERKMRENGGWEPAGDKVGGARNDSYQNLGKVHSFANQARKGTSKLNERASWTPK